MINVTDETGKVIAQVEYNHNLDNWDGSNWTCGRVGRHLGITKLKKSGEYVLIHGTQWSGERDTAKIVSPLEAYHTIVRMDHRELLEEYPDLKKFEKDIETEEE